MAAAPDHPVYLGLKMTMFGDETWERISPVRFLRSDPTTSFFVSDYSQVSLIHSLKILIDIFDSQFIFVYQKSLKGTFKTSFLVQNHTLNLYSRV